MATRHFLAEVNVDEADAEALRFQVESQIGRAVLRSGERGPFLWSDERVSVAGVARIRYYTVSRRVRDTYEGLYGPIRLESGPEPFLEPQN